jgi:hypothetical protein
VTARPATQRPATTVPATVEPTTTSPTDSGLDPASMLAAARRGGDYLVRATGSDGRFIYRYDAATDSADDSYNILRHAGTTFSLLQLYRVTEEPLYLATAERALDFLLATTVACPGPPGIAAPTGQPAGAVPGPPDPLPELLCVEEDEEIKLGGNALAIIALAERADATGSREHVPQMQALARWIVALQSTEGEFLVHKLEGPGGEPSDFVSGYYPGEALLALLRLYEIDGDERWLDAAESGARWLIEVRDGALSDGELAHDHWLLYALERLSRHRPAPLWQAHASRLARVIMDAQLRPETLFPGEEDWAGGWYRPPRSTPAATRAEGLAAAWAIANAAGDTALAAAIRESLAASIRYQLRTQVDRGTAAAWPSPSRAVGGFRRDLESDEIRIDYVQHNISALLMFRMITRGDDPTE